MANTTTKLHVRGLWDAARQGDDRALAMLLAFLITDGPSWFAGVLRRRASQRSGRTTEVMQRAAIDVMRRARNGTLPKPPAEPSRFWGLIIGFITFAGRATWRFMKGTPKEWPTVLEPLPVEDALVGPAADPCDMASQAEEGTDRDRLHRAMDALSVLDRRLLERSLQGATPRELAAELNSNEVAIRQALHRARKHLAGKLRGESS